jgi:hypothetical protein
MIRAPLFAEPCGDRPGWYIADAEMRDVLGVIYISKRAAVASIRGMPAAAAGHPLFYMVKEFGDAYYVPGIWVQAHHLDLSYYDRLFQGGYSATQAEHDRLWHGRNTPSNRSEGLEEDTRR